MPESILRVVFASHSSSLDGGAERSLLEVAVALKKDGRVDPVVTVPSDGALAAALGMESIQSYVVSTPWWTFDSGGIGAIGPIALARDFVRRARIILALRRSVVHWLTWLRAERPDVVVTNTAVIPTPAMASAASGIPHIWWVHEFVTRDHGFTYALGESLGQRLIGRLSRVVVVNSKAVKEHFSPPIRPEKVRLIYEGIVGFEGEPSVIRLPDLRALVLGNLTSTKGVALALWAASILKSERLHLHLRLVGRIRGAYREELCRLATDLGITDRVEICDATMTPESEIAWANVILMCSRSEAFGRVTVEALKSGRPVVGARSGGTTELISDGVNGLLFTPGDAKGLANALRRLATEPGLLPMLSENARPSVQDRFVMQDEVDRFVAIFRTAADRPAQNSGRRIG